MTDLQPASGPRPPGDAYGDDVVPGVHLPGVRLHRAVRSSQLIDGLAELLASHPLDPFLSEIVAVPTPGVERWLGQALSLRLGVTAGIDFVAFGPWLSQLWSQASRDLLPVAEGDRVDDPWRAEALTWQVITAIDAAADQDWAQPVIRHVGGDETVHGRRFLTASRIAGLFHRYGRQRPQMLLSWLAGDDVDDAGQALSPRHRWQAQVWRSVRSAIAVASPAERIEHVTAVLRDRPDELDLPERISVFGLNRLDRLDRVMLDGLAAHRQVHLWLAHPSPARWERLGPRLPAEPWPSRTTVPGGAGGNTVLDRLGREVHEFQHVITHLDTALTDTALPPPELPATLLGALQQAIVSDRATPATPYQLSDDDHSVQIHSCHGPDRQVEVLRDVVCGLLQDDPTLEPRDIMIMCPDLPRFAPLVAATFDAMGSGPITSHGHPGRRLRIRIADQSLTEVNPMLAVVERLLELAQSRITASALVDLCSRGPVAARFRFDAQALETIQALVTDSGIRWGLDGADRARFGLEGFRQNTVKAGLARMLLGVALAETDHHHVGLVLPLDRVDSSTVDLVGRLVEFVDRLTVVLAELSTPHTLTGWVGVLHRLIDLLLAPEPGEDWQRGHAWSTVQALVDEGEHDSPELDLGDIRAVLGDSLQGRPARANFRTGSLTLSSLAPMRSVPHKVICLLGMDDRAFPRGHGVDGDDLLALTPRVGDRDRRAEDRQLLLDAVVAAEQTLVVVHSGKDARTNADQPAAVPIGTLVDALGDLVGPEQRPLLTDRIVQSHPLQPYAPANFSSGGLSQSFDRTALGAALAASGPRTPTPPAYGPIQLPEPDAAARVELSELNRFFKHPIKALLRERGGLTLPEPPDDKDPDAMPLELDHLESWSVGQRILEGRLDGVAEDTLVDAEWRRGELPPRRLGSHALHTILSEVDAVVTATAGWTGQPRRQLDLSVEGDGWAVTGTATRVHGQHIVHTHYSRTSPVHWLEAWWQLLALSCTHPDQEWKAVVIGRKSPPVVLGPVVPSHARAFMADALVLRRLGLSEPLPLPPKTAGSYALRRSKGRSAERAWADTERTRGFEYDQWWQLFHSAAFADLRKAPAVPGEHRGPDPDEETSRFQCLARRLFHPLVTRAEGVVA